MLIFINQKLFVLKIVIYTDLYLLSGIRYLKKLFNNAIIEHRQRLDEDIESKKSLSK